MTYQIFGAFVCFFIMSIVFAFSIIIFRTMVGYDIMEKRKRNTLKYYRLRRVGFWRWLLLKDYKEFAKRWHYVLYIVHFFVGAAAVILITISALFNNSNRIINMLCGLIFSFELLLVSVPLCNRYFQRMSNPMKPYGKSHKK